MRRAFPRQLYRRRALIESVFSSVKRKLSARAPGRSLRMQIRQALLLGLSFNLYRLRHRNFFQRMSLQAENIALRHQITVLQRNRKHLCLNSGDRFFWVWLSRLWTDWRSHWPSLSRRQLAVGIAKDFVSTGHGKAEVRRSGAG